MLLNFWSSLSEHAGRLKQIIRSFGAADDTLLIFSASQSEQVEVPTTLTFVSPLLRDIIASITLCSETLTITTPACSSTSIKHLTSLLSDGCTQFSPHVEDVEAIIEVGKMVGIDLKNLTYDEVTKTVEGEGVEEGKIKGVDKHYEDNNLE